MNTKIGFRNSMFVYALESAVNPSSLKVSIPEAFLHESSISPSEVKLQKGSNNIFLNATPPALSSYITSYNYISLPVIGSGLTSINVKGLSYNGSTGIGSVTKGQRLIAEFTNNSPDHGLIIARC